MVFTSRQGEVNSRTGKMEPRGVCSLSRRRVLLGLGAAVIGAGLPRRAWAVDLDAQCAISEQQLTDLITQMDSEIAAHCGQSNTLDCPSLLPAGRTDSFRGQLDAIEDELSSAFCGAGIGESEIIARAGLDTDFPELVAYFQSENLSFGTVLCSTMGGGVPAGGPARWFVLAGVLGAAGVLLLHRRRVTGAMAIGGAVAAGSLIAPGRASAQSLQLVDILEIALQEVVPAGTDVRCAARILATVMEMVVPVNLALEFAERLVEVKNDPGVQTVLNSILQALYTVWAALIMFRVGQMKDGIKDVTKELSKLVTELDRFPAAKSVARRFARALGARLAKCLGVVFIAVDASLTLIAEWDKIRADC